ncbi:hypothetical protein, partial [Pseudomonas sp. 2822-17]|uniref:hypothetical protein n=1 Tax=Pseudomonas sp. 2822-17 TaxID=1712678 RepID=UPI000C670872
IFFRRGITNWHWNLFWNHAIIAKNRPTIVPSNWDQPGSPTDGTRILKQHGIPTAIRRIHDPTLGYALII